MASIISTYPPDSAIVRRVLNGKRNDFGILIQRHVNAVQAVAMAYVGSSPDADDIVQEAFAKALEKLDTLHDLKKFRSWLLSIVRRLCVDTKRVQANEVASDVATLEQEVVVSRDQGREELRQILLSRIYALEPQAREVLLLHYYAGFSTREIAAELEVTQEAVKKRLQRARDMLSRDLSNDLRELLTPEKSHDAHATRIATALAVAAVPWIPRTASASVTSAIGSSLASTSLGWIAAATLIVLTIVGWQSLRNEPPVDPSAVSVAIPSLTPSPSPAPSPNALAAVAASSGNDAQQDAQFIVARAEETDTESTGDTLPLLGSIMATTLSAEGEPVEGVSIVAERIDWEPYESPPANTLVRRGLSDKQGRFFFADLPLGDYVVRAGGENVAGIVLTQLGTGSFTKESRLYLQPSAPLSGRVVNAEGKPVPNAYVYTYGNKKDPKERYLIYRSGARTQTDGDGRFGFSHLTRDQWKIYVIADGYAVYLSDYIPAGKDDAEFVLTVGKTAAVSVVDDKGKPLSGVQVQLAARDAYRDRRQVMTASDGTAFFTNLRNVAYLISLQDAKYTSVGGPVPLDIADGKSTATVTAQSSARISGTVTLTDGTPVPDTVIRAEPPETSGLNPVMATTNKDGRYTLLGLGEATYTISSRHYAGFVPASEETPAVACKPGNQIDDMNFKFSESATVSGNVVDAAGKPVSGAEVHFSAGYTQTIVRTTVMSGATGNFAVRGLRADARYFIWAKTDTQLSPPLGPFTLDADSKESMSIRIDDAATVAGKVVDQDGRPAVGIGVMASAMKSIDHALPASSTEYASIGSMTTDTAADGSFSIGGLPGGDYSIQLSNPGDNSYKYSNIRRLTLKPGEKKSGLAVVWEDTRGALTVTGRVVDRLGQPISRANVFARSESPTDFFSASTDAQGNFTLTKLREGELDVSVSHDRYSPETKTGVLAGASGLTIVLQDNGELTLHVVDAASGSPLKEFEYGIGNGRIDILMDGLKKAKAEDGTVRVSEINVGNRSVLIRADGYAEQIAVAHVRSRNEGESSSTVRLTPGARIDALVTDPEGNPLSQVVVFRDYYVEDPRGRSPFEVGTTGSDGRLKIDYLSSEPYDFYLNHTKFAPLHVEVTPIPGETSQLTWALQQGGSVSGRLLHNDTPANDAWVSVKLGADHFTFTRGAKTSADGTFKIDRVPPGTYELWTQWRPEDNMYFRWDSHTVTVERNRDTVLDVNMPSGSGALQGHYRINGDTRTNNMYVILNYANGTGGYQFGSRDGSFHLQNMPPGVLTGEARFTENGEEQRVLLDPIEIRKDETTPLEIDLSR